MAKHRLIGPCIRGFEVLGLVSLGLGGQLDSWGGITII